MDQKEPSKWRQPCIVLSIAVLALALLMLSDTPVQRVRDVSSGMTREEVHRIMGEPQMRFRVSEIEMSFRLPRPVDGQFGIESGECWDYGGVTGRYFEHFKRKLGVLKTLKTRARHPVEIRYDASDRVVAVEIHEIMD